MPGRHRSRTCASAGPTAPLPRGFRRLGKTFEKLPLRNNCRGIATIVRGRLDQERIDLFDRPDGVGADAGIGSLSAGWDNCFLPIPTSLKTCRRTPPLRRFRSIWRHCFTSIIGNGRRQRRRCLRQVQPPVPQGHLQRNAFMAAQVQEVRARLGAFRRTQLRQGDRIRKSRAEHDSIVQAIAEGDGDTNAGAHVERRRGASVIRPAILTPRSRGIGVQN